MHPTHTYLNPATARAEAHAFLAALRAAPPVTAAVATTGFHGPPVAVTFQLPDGAVLHTLLRTTAPIEAGAQARHGIDQQAALAAPTLEEMYPALAERCALPVVAMNAGFARAALDRATQAAGLDPLPTRHWVDAQLPLSALHGTYQERKARYSFAALGEVAQRVLPAGTLAQLAPEGTPIGTVQRLSLVLAAPAEAHDAALDAEAFCPACQNPTDHCQCDPSPRSPE